MRNSLNIIPIFIFFRFACFAQEKTLASGDTIVKSLEVMASITKNDTGKANFTYRLRNLKNESIYIDTTYLFVSYFMAPANSARPNVISLSMSGGAPSHGTVSIISLKAGKTFVKKIALDSTGFSAFSFEILFFTESRLKEMGAPKGRAYHQFHSMVYLGSSERLMINSKSK